MKLLLHNMVNKNDSMELGYSGEQTLKVKCAKKDVMKKQ